MNVLRKKKKKAWFFHPIEKGVIVLALQEEAQRVKKQIDGINTSLTFLQRYIMGHEEKAAANEVNQLVTKTQRLAIGARYLPLQAGIKDATKQLCDDFKESFDMQVSITQEGWGKVRLPSILPHSGNAARFLRKPLQAALAEYFDRYSREKGRRFRIRNAVVAFVFFYAWEIPTERCCDIDNIGNTEVKAVLDDIATYTIPDDGPFQLYHFYMGSRAKESFTEVYIIPQTEFGLWYNQQIENQKVLRGAENAL